MTSFTLSNVEAIDLAKSTHPISTGVGFFDHMLDQLNSHAQIGVSVTAALALDTKDNDSSASDHNRHADEDQEQLMSQVGSAIGAELKKIIPANTSRLSRFCCPLDEALVECILEINTGSASNSGSGAGSGELSSSIDSIVNIGRVTTFELAPYGIYPKTGRTQIGKMKTAPLHAFFTELALSSGLNISLKKVRGHNGHHIVESSFKAFSRALRNIIDGTCTTNSTHQESVDNTMNAMWGIGSQSFKEGMALKRGDKSSRTTKETSIDVQVDLDGGARGVTITTGIQTLDIFYENLAKDSGMSLFVVCKGDTWVDDHHTSEDVSIAVGKVLNNALGTKAGLNRMWCATAKVGDAEVEVTMDLSNRPCLTHNLSIACAEYVGDMSTEMLDHVLDSLVMNGQMTVHVLELSKGQNNSDDDMKDLANATALAFGKALKLCAAVDPRRAGKTASSKGTLSA
jgi:imidazoleglycerol-phosphate dehydratase